MRFRKQVEKEYFETKEKLEQLERELAEKYRRKNRYDKNKAIENQRSKVWREQQKLNKMLEEKGENKWIAVITVNYLFANNVN